MTRILFAGCGDLAIRTANNLPTSHQKTGLRRNISLLPKGFDAMAIDLCQKQQVAEIAKEQFDYVVVTLTPGGKPYQQAYVQPCQNLAAALSNKPPKRVLYISSTSVYHQRAHEWVDENSPAKAEGTGNILREAENIWLESNIPSTVLRLSGIYGDSRTFLLKRLLQGAVAATGTHFSNRIHADDAGRAIAHLLQLDQSGHALETLYIVSDDEPADQHTLIDWIQTTFGVTPNPEIVLGRRAGSKRCNNARLKASGFKLHYPTFREGYLHAIEKSGLLL